MLTSVCPVGLGNTSSCQRLCARARASLEFDPPRPRRETAVRRVSPRGDDLAWLHADLVANLSLALTLSALAVGGLAGAAAFALGF